MEAKPSPSTSAPQGSLKYLEDRGRHSLLQFLQTTTCYDAMPTSSKIPVFEMEVPFSFVLYAFVEQSAEVAPVWDSSTGSFIGLITLTDFMNFVRHFHPDATKELAHFSIRVWREYEARYLLGSNSGEAGDEAMEGESPSSPASQPSKPALESSKVYANPRIWPQPDTPLLDAVETMLAHGMEHLPVLDPEQMAVMCMLDLNLVLQYAATHFQETRRMYDGSVKDLGIGTWGGLVVARNDTPLLEVLHLLAKHSISAVPIVDPYGRVVDIYKRSDLKYLARRNLMGATQSIGDFKAEQRKMDPSSTSVQLAPEQSTLLAVLYVFVTKKVHHVVCVDAEGRCTGIISLTDVFRYLLDPSLVKRVRSENRLFLMPDDQGPGGNENERHGGGGGGSGSGSGGSGPAAGGRDGASHSVSNGSPPRRGGGHSEGGSEHGDKDMAGDTTPADSTVGATTGSRESSSAVPIEQMQSLSLSGASSACGTSYRSLHGSCYGHDGLDHVAVAAGP